MCGRYTLTNPTQIPLRFEAEVDGDGDAIGDPAYNIAPTQSVAVVTERQGTHQRVLTRMRWGFQPAWMKEKEPGKPAPINARAETIAERPMFRGALARQRCLIPADGFYEWQEAAGQRAKQPYYIHLKDSSLFALAGIYTRGQDAAGELWASCAIVTTEPNSLMTSIHNRMPVILPRDLEAAWLDSTLTDPAFALGCLRPYRADLMEAYPVSPMVSSARNNGAALLEPLGW